MVKKYEHKGHDYTMMELCRLFKVNKDTMRYRLRNGMTVKEAIEIPVRYQSKPITITHEGKELTLSKAASKSGVNVCTARYRHRKGLNDSEILERKDRRKGRKSPKKMITYGDFTGNVSEFCKKFDINRSTFIDRLNKGMTVEEALKKPIKYQKPKQIYVYQGYVGTLCELSILTGINKNTLASRIKFHVDDVTDDIKR